MSSGEIVVLAAICGSFIVFAAVLAWGDFETRNIRHDKAATPQTSKH